LIDPNPQTSITLPEFLAAGISHPDLPPFRAIKWHPLRAHLMFMDDAEGRARLVYHYLHLLRISGVQPPHPDPAWETPPAPPLRSDHDLRPDAGGRLSHSWAPDGGGIRTAAMPLLVSESAVTLNGVSLPFTVADDVFHIDWPGELDLRLGIGTAGGHNLIFCPRSFNLSRMLSTLDSKWVEEAKLGEQWASCVWEWEKAAVLWNAVAVLELGETVIDPLADD
jgi:hypothetical protein